MASVTGATTVNVPFNFTVQGKSLPAGQYLVQRDSSGSFLRLQGKDGGKSFVWITGVTANGENRVILRFDDVNQTRVLNSIQYGPLLTPTLDKKERKTENLTPLDVVGE